VFPVTIGTPKQTLNLIFDTASGDFWVWSWLMPVDMLQNRKYYNGSASSDATPWEGQSWGATYAVGSNYGIVWQDIVWVDAIGVAGNPIECSQGVSNWFASLPGVDGVLGLSYAYNDSERPEPQQTWITYILPLLSCRYPKVPSSQMIDSSSTCFYGLPRPQWNRYHRLRVH